MAFPIYIPLGNILHRAVCVRVCVGNGFECLWQKKLLLTRAQSGGKRERIESVMMTDELPVSATDTERVKPTFYSFVSPPKEKMEIASIELTQSIPLCRKRAERDALCGRAGLAEGGVGDSRSTSGFICPEWRATLWQLCCPRSCLKTVCLIAISSSLPSSTLHHSL